MLLLSGALIGLATYALPTLCAPVVDRGSVHVGRSGLKASRLVESPHVISLTRKAATTSHRSRVAKFLEVEDPGNGTQAGIAVLTPYKDIQYFTNITFGTETFEAVVDTGSSDTWLVQTGFQCVDVGTLITYPEAECAFGPTYTPSSTFKQIPGENFQITYGDGETLTGILGTEDVTLGGITVKNQEVGVVNYTAWNGDHTSSGLIGLSFPGITSAFNGTDPELNTPSEEINYTPLFTSMYQQGLVEPFFSLAIFRDDNFGGYLALGGLPPVKHSSKFAEVAMEMTSVARPGNGPKTEFQFYTITIDGVEYGNSSDASTKLQADVDSGTSLTFLPSQIASAINQQFDPPAAYSRNTGEYEVDCSAKAPLVGITIGGCTFSINPADMILPSINGGCTSGITNTPYGFRRAVLGDTFLRNVLAVFDVGHLVMAFAARGD
ncbi:MAG: hypothetical protein Q9222_007184 [Ikaeria aurantiellina]